MDKILLLSPHTDDVELGAGGTVQKFLEEGKQIYWIVFSTAEESLPAHMDKDTLEREFVSVMKQLGVEPSHYMINRFKVRKLHERRQEILELLVKVRKEFNPDLVIGPSLNDFHQDHVVVANEMVRAFKSSASIICYELPWNHVSFNTQFFVQLETRHIKRKLEVLKLYKSQVIKERNYFSNEFIFGLAKTRGVQINNNYAEAFEVIRWIV